LLSAKISFVTQAYSKGLLGTDEGDIVPVEKLIVHDEYANNEPMLLGKSYSWNRIQSASDFVIKNSGLSDDNKSTISQYQWVLNFYETEYTQFDNALWLGLINPILGYAALANSTGTVVSDVTILDLTFEVDGDVYTRGVVDNKQTGSIDPINKETDFSKIFAFILGAVALVLIVAIGWPVILPVLSFILNCIVWVIKLPFKLIDMLFGGGKKE
jgi:hypothetical protein